MYSSDSLQSIVVTCLHSTACESEKEGNPSRSSQIANGAEAWAILREFGKLQFASCRPKKVQMLVNAWPSETEQCQVFAIYVVPFVKPWASMSWKLGTTCDPLALDIRSQDTGGPGARQRSRSFWHVWNYYCKSAKCQGRHGICCASQDPASSLQDDAGSGQVHTWQARNQQQALNDRYICQNTMASTNCECCALRCQCCSLL